MVWRGYTRKQLFYSFLTVLSILAFRDIFVKKTHSGHQF